MPSVRPELTLVPDRELDRRLVEAHDEVERFEGPEHRTIGDLAAKSELTSVAYDEAGSLLTFGEVVALAGDYFRTYDEMKALSTNRVLRKQLAWARWDCLGLPRKIEPDLPETLKFTVKQRYYLLASGNITHFSAGGTASKEYTRWHTAALLDAFESGQRASQDLWRRALTKEAFGQHFLTDMFAAGHVRTPRASIDKWYRREFPDRDQLIRYMAQFIYTWLVRHGEVSRTQRAFDWAFKVVRSQIRKRILALGGEAVKAFTLGEIVALALHDEDNKRLQVVSTVNELGQTVSNGYRWTAVGDSHLEKVDHEGTDREFKLGKQTKDMAVAACVTSLRELDKVRLAGTKLSGRNVSLTKLPAIAKVLGASARAFVFAFAAKAFIPREDLTPGANVPLPSGDGVKSPLDWRWGRLGPKAYDVIDECIKKRVADELSKQLKFVTDARARRGLSAFVDHLRLEGIRVLVLATGRRAR